MQSAVLSLFLQSFALFLRRPAALCYNEKNSGSDEE